MIIKVLILHLACNLRHGYNKSLYMPLYTRRWFDSLKKINKGEIGSQVNCGNFLIMPSFCHTINDKLVGRINFVSK